MLTAVVRAFQTPDLHKKLLFTAGIIVLFRFGSCDPANFMEPRSAPRH
ncbi:MAG: hypothetical protein JO345_38895 [Streptosporangiaceae bacterium]|nr:hypothetical protein [Streptosporangiaceae bacterium]